MAETEQGDPLTDIGESSGDVANGESGIKSDIKGENTPKKRGRPKGSTVKAAGDMNGGMPKRPRGEDEPDKSLSSPRKRGRPKGSLKKLTQKIETSDDNGTEQNTPTEPKKSQAKGKRGRPKKVVQVGATEQEPAADGTERPRKSPGRPKGSRNKPVFTVRLESTSGRPTRVIVAPEKLNMTLPGKSPGKRGRPKKMGRGRPKKRPLSPEEEPYLPRVWKALGRPRKYPKKEPPEGASSPETPSRGRGRPRKSESKKGAHLKKISSDGTPNKPKATKEQDGSPRKRGRPKGSVANKAIINNSSKKMSQNSDENAEDVPEDGDVSNPVPDEDNGMNNAVLEDGL